jgi:hypothetical protein
MSACRRIDGHLAGGSEAMTEDAIGMLTRGWARGAGIRWAAAAAMFMLPATAGTAAAATTPMQLTYRVTHSVYGNIGTYTNRIEPSAGGTTVQTQAHFQVKLLGVNMYREDAQRTERWQGNRLISFNGVTSKGSESTVVKGEARGNSFVISSPQGTITAPATVHPANPWSPNFLASSTMMRPDSGKIERVSVSGGQQTVVDLDGKPVRAEKYEVNGAARYGVWLDSRGVPVMFVVDDDSGKVTFTLASCTGCDVTPTQQLGMK